LVANPPRAVVDTALGSSKPLPVGAISWNDEPLIVLTSATIADAIVEDVRVVVIAAWAGAARAPSAAKLTTEAITEHFRERVIVRLLVLGAECTA
jgi:hypothetical protein